MQAKLLVVSLSLLVATVLVACSSEPASLTNPDAPARTGCRHFAAVFNDHRNGVLTSSELLTKYREVYDDLKLSEVPGLGDKAAELRRQMAQNPSMGAGNSWTYRLLDDCAKVIENS